MTPLSTPAAQGTVADELVDRLLAWPATGDGRDGLSSAYVSDLMREAARRLSASPSPEALPASGVEAPEYVVGVGELGPKGHVYYVLSGGGMGEAVARVYPGPDAERMAKVMAAALSSAPAPEDRT